MQFIIDFDYTIFNTVAFRDALAEVVEFFGVTREQFDAAEMALSTQQLYHIDQHIELMALSGQATQMREAVEPMLSDLRQFLYPDVMQFMEQYKKEQMTIVTFGNTDWQRLKVEAVDLGDYVDEVLYVEKSKKDLFVDWDIQSSVIFLNDRGSEIDAVAAIQPHWKYIWVRRLDTKYVDEICTANHVEVADLLFDSSVIQTR